MYDCFIIITFIHVGHACGLTPSVYTSYNIHIYVCVGVFVFVFYNT